MSRNKSIYSLTDEQLETFDKQGFIGPFTLFDSEQMKELWNKRIRKELLYREDCVFQNSRLNYDRHLDLKSLQQIVTSPVIVDKVASIMGNDLLCWRTEWFPKYPGDGGTEWHQAKRFFEFENQPKLTPPEHLLEGEKYWVVTVWIAMTDATLENGCMKFMPGSHKENWFFDESKGNNFDQEKVAVNDNSGFFGYSWENLKVDSSWKPDESKAVTMEVKAGQFFVFTSKCLHGSFPNISETDTRFAMAARYVIPEVAVYQNLKTFDALGEVLDLDKYATLLVSGEDKVGINKVKEPWL
ncbi:chlorinating enzyme [Sessilibacter sp. MAH1]